MADVETAGDGEGRESAARSANKVLSPRSVAGAPSTVGSWAVVEQDHVMDEFHSVAESGMSDDEPIPHDGDEPEPEGDASQASVKVKAKPPASRGRSIASWAKAGVLSDSFGSASGFKWTLYESSGVVITASEDGITASWLGILYAIMLLTLILLIVFYLGRCWGRSRRGRQSG